MALTSDQLVLARMYLSDQASSAVQSIQIDNALGGTFTLSFSGQTTAAVAYNAGANAIQNALAALSTIGTGSVNVVDNAGVPGSMFWTVYFSGALAGLALSMLTVNLTGLTGVAVLSSVTQTVAGGVTAFTDDELNMLYTDARFNFYLAICYGYRVLQADASRFTRYTAGQTQDFKEQVFEHLDSLAAQYENWARAAKQVQFTSLVPVPPRLRAVPWQVGVPATSLVYGRPYGRRGNW